MKKFLVLFFLIATAVSAQVPSTPVTGQITAATTNVTCGNQGTQNGGAVDQPINGFTGAVGVSVTGVWAATLNVQASVDHGSTWKSVTELLPGSTFTVNKQLTVSTVGDTDVCVFASAYVSGTAIVTFSPSTLQSAVTQFGINGGAPIPIATDPNGITDVGVVGGGSDGFLNNFAGFQFTGRDVGNGTIGLANVTPMFFNGVSWDRQFYCNTTTFQAGIAATTAQIVAGVAGKKIRVCSIIIERNDVTGVATTVKLQEGTGAACAVGTTQLTGNLFTSGATAVTGDSPPVVIVGGNTAPFFTKTAADALCVTTTGAASNFDVTITFDQH